MTQTVHNCFQAIASFQDFPKPGVIYWDFTPLISNPLLFKQSIIAIRNHFQNCNINKIAIVEAKGFIIGSALAFAMNLPLICVRKPGLTPGIVFSEKFEKEYGFGEYQIKKGVVSKRDRVLIVYDILAGSGPTQAAIHLIEKSGGTVAGCAYVIELEYLHGREKLTGYNLYSLVKITKRELK